MLSRAAAVRRWFLPFALATTLLGAPAAAQHVRRAPREAGTPGRLLVSSFTTGAIHTYRARDGAPRKRIQPVQGAQSIRPGPDGLLYACAEQTDEIVRIDPDALALVDAFVSDDPLTSEDETGGIDGPTSAAFGPTGDLYVASFETDQVLRYDGATGAFLGVFVSSGSGGLDGPDAGTLFGPDGNLYVPSFFNDRILRFDGGSGAFVDEFVSFREDGLRQPRDIAFHQGLVYVASSGSGQILRWEPDGDFAGVFATSGVPYSLAFNPDDGNLYVVALQGDSVRIFDGLTGTFLRRAIEPGAGGIDAPTFVTFVR